MDVPTANPRAESCTRAPHLQPFLQPFYSLFYGLFYGRLRVPELTRPHSGAGGLGCEILKNLALSGFRDIEVIDMDSIDVSNLNRQFLFRAADVGASKAAVAARRVMARVPGVKITPHDGRIQDKDEAYYRRFQLVVCGLDSIEARRWINATLVDLFDPDDQESLKPLIDGGTEGKDSLPRSSSY